MSRWHDIVDWVGGLPFEVATPHAIFAFYHDRGFTLQRCSLAEAGWGATNSCSPLNSVRHPQMEAR